MNFNPATKQAGMPFVSKFVRVILVDARKAMMPRRYEMSGMLNIPASFNTNVRQRINWHFTELVEPIVGVLCDVTTAGCNIVVPVMTDAEMERVNGGFATFDDLIGLFHQYEPTLHKCQ